MIVDVRKRVAVLFGPYAELIAWGLAVARAADIYKSNLSDASFIEVWAAMRPDCLCELNDRFVKLDALVDLYLTDASQ